MTGVLLALGSVNADFVVRVDEPPEIGRGVLGHDLVRLPGGKAANVAVLAARLGAPVRLLGCVGDDDLAALAVSGPRAVGVDVQGVRRRAGATGWASVVVGPDGDKAIVLVLGANDAWAADADAVGTEVGAAPPGSVLVASLEIPPAVVAAALGAARHHGTTVVVDPAPPERLDPALAGTFHHLTPDHREATALCGVDASDDAGAVAAAQHLHRRWGGVVHVKRAGGGVVVVSGDGAWRVDAPEVEVVDTTGAGDAYAGGLGWALLHGADAVEAARVAVATSTCAVGVYGSQPSYPDRAALDAVLAQVSPAAAL